MNTVAKSLVLMLAVGLGGSSFAQTTDSIPKIGETSQMGSPVDQSPDTSRPVLSLTPAMVPETKTAEDLVEQQKKEADAELAVRATEKKEAAPKVVRVKKKSSSLKITEGSSSAASAPKEFTPPPLNEVTVSDRDLNRFLFPSPVTQILFPAGAPLAQDPTYLAKNRQAVIQFSQVVEKPVQMIVEMDSGQVITLYLKIRPIRGVEYKVQGKAPVDSVAASGGYSTPASTDMKLVEQLITQGGLDGFETLKLPGISRFDSFSAVPLAVLSDKATRKVSVFQLVAAPGKVAVVAPPQFYREGVTFVEISGDRVDDRTSPLVYIVEEVASND